MSAPVYIEKALPATYTTGAAFADVTNWFITFAEDGYYRIEADFIYNASGGEEGNFAIGVKREGEASFVKLDNTLRSVAVAAVFTAQVVLIKRCIYFKAGESVNVIAKYSVGAGDIQVNAAGSREATLSALKIG